MNGSDVIGKSLYIFNSSLEEKLQIPVLNDLESTYSTVLIFLQLLIAFRFIFGSTVV